MRWEGSQDHSIFVTVLSQFHRFDHVHPQTQEFLARLITVWGKAELQKDIWRMKKAKTLWTFYWPTCVQNIPLEAPRVTFKHLEYSNLQIGRKWAAFMLLLRQARYLCQHWESGSAVSRQRAQDLWTGSSGCNCALRLSPLRLHHLHSNLAVCLHPD